MYKISKEFSFAMSHRLSCHQGNCRHIHGHNYKIIVGIKTEELNDNGMVMDFSDLKKIVSKYLNTLDHALMVNDSDDDMISKIIDVIPDLKFVLIPYEPTAENMARDIYYCVDADIPNYAQMDYVTVYETDTSQATYTES